MDDTYDITAEKAIELAEKRHFVEPVDAGVLVATLTAEHVIDHFDRFMFAHALDQRGRGQRQAVPLVGGLELVQRFAMALQGPYQDLVPGAAAARPVIA